MPDQVDIKIQTTADTRGAEQAAASLEKVNKQTTKTKEVTKDTAKEVNSLGETFEKGASAGRVLGEVTRGNVFAIGSLGAVIKAVGEAFKTNPLFLIGSIAATLILPAIAKIAAGWKSVEERAKEAGKASGEANAAALAAVSERRDNALAEIYSEISKRAAEAKAAIEAVTIAQTAQIDAEEAVQMARINADKSLSEEQRVVAIADTRREFRGRRTQQQLGTLDAQEAAAQAEVQARRTGVGAAQADEQAARNYLTSVTARTPKDIERELASAKDRLPLVRQASSNIFGSQADRDRFSREARQLEQRIPDLERELSMEQEAYAPRLKAAQDLLAKRTAARVKAEQDAADADRSAAGMRDTNLARRTALQTTLAANNQVDDINRPALVDAARAKDAERARQQARSADLELIGADAGNFADQIRQTLARTPAGQSKEGQAAIKALAEAVAAARADGTTEQEAQSLVEALQGVRELLGQYGRGSATLMLEVATLKQQLANLGRNNQ